MKLKNVFTSGKMNKDSDERLIQKGEYRHALNVRVANSNGSDVGAVENALSNAKMSSINFGSNAKTIGTVEDDAANKIYWCVVSDNGSFVCEFSKDTEQASVIISDNRAGDLNQLGFTPSNMVDMSILNDAENNKNFLFLTDGATEPKYFEIDTAKALANNTFTFEDVSLIKPAPYTAPLIELQKTDSKEENYLETKFFSFAYRYIYDNNEISAVSPFSEFAFMPNEFRYDYNSGTNKSMENEYNKAVVSFNTGSKNVKKIEILAKQSGDDITYIVEKLDKEDKGWNDNAVYEYTFTNSKVYKALPESQLRRVYDNVPRKAKTLEIIGNRVVFGNYTENYNMSNSGVSIIPKLDLSYTSTSGTKGIPHKTIKTNMDYEVGISYTDGKGRMTTPFTSEGSSVHVPITNSDKKNTLNVEISSKAPDWAEGYRFFIKQSRNDYDVISPVVFYREGVYAYIKVEGEDINKVKEGDFLFLKSDTSGIRKTPTKVKVLESESKTRNFLEDDSEKNTIQEAGNYIKVDTEEIALDETSVDTFLYDGYAFRTDVTKNDFGSPAAYIEDAVFYGDGLNDISVSGTYSSTTDTRYEIEILSEGSPDRFRWRELDCKENSYSPWNDNNDAGIVISGSTTLSNGLSISFSSTTGHTESDRWVINAKSASRPTEWNEGGDVNSFGRKAIMNFKCKSVGSESIKAGAIITIEYNDSRSEPNVDNISGNVYQRFVSSSNYDNIEEWFWEDNVLSKMSHPKDPSEILFRRGNLDTAPDKVLGERLFINPSGDLFMSILSESNYTGSGKVRVDVTFKIIELDNPIIFETDYKFSSSEVFYELPKTYGVSNGNHSGDVNQVFGTTNALVNLDHFNAFGWYNGYESIKIADGFNQSRMILDSKPLVPLDNYKEITRVASLTYSGIYESTTSFNGVNEFNLSTANYKDLDPSFGKIAKIISRNGDLTVIQNNRVSRVLYSKSVIYNADGSGNVSQNNNVLGQEVPYQGEFGISNNIYAATKWNGDIYFADERRGSVIRLTDNGIFPISTYGMISWFNDHLYVGSNIVSSFDPNNDQFVLSISNPNIEWVEDTYECEEYITTTTTSNVTTTTTQCFVDVELPINACAIEWLEDTYSCGYIEWNEDTYECNVEDPTVTWIEDTYECNIEGTTTTSTASPTVTWIEDTYECNIEGTTTTSTAAPTTTTTSTAAPTTTTTSTAAPTTTTTSTAAPTTTTTTATAPTTTTTSTAAPTTTTTSTAAPTTTTTSTAAPTTTTTSTAAPTTTTTSTAAPTTTTTSTAAPTTTTTSTAAPTTTTTSTAAPTTTTTTEQPCNCVTVDVLNTQLTSGGLDLYYIYNSCGSGETSVNLNTYFGIEQNGSTYFAFCQTGSSSNMYKYGPSGNAFVGLEGMNTVPNTNTCNSDFDCSPVVPTTTTTTAAPTTAAPTTTTTTTQIPAGTLLSTYCDGTTKMGTYADGGGGSYTNAIEFNSVDCGYVDPAGTLLSTYCDGTTKMGTYANGSGGSYNQVIEYNSTDCGYVYPAGTLLSTFCFGYDLFGEYADGSGGTYTDLIETNSSSCGYEAPTTTTTTTAAPTTTTTTTAAPTTTTTTTAAPTTTTTTTAAPTTTTTTTAAPTTTTTTTAAPTTTTTTVALNPTCHEVTYDSSVYGLDQNRYGIAYVDYQGNFVTARFNDMLASVNGSELIYYVCADTVSQDVWDVNNNVAVPQYNSSLSRSSSGESCDGFCSPPGGGGF